MREVNEALRDMTAAKDELASAQLERASLQTVLDRSAAYA